MSNDIVAEIKGEFESGGNWPYISKDHRFEQNPFADTWPGPQVFAGHELELRRLQENIQRNIHTFISGPFGVGKTVLTQTMYNILDDVEGYAPVFVAVQKGRYSKAMAEKILDELDQDFDSSDSKSDLYDQIANTLVSLREDGCRAVFFYDEVINGSEGTLRSILHLQRDINNWEPVLVLNGTTHTMDQIQSTIAPLSDRIGDVINLEQLDLDATVNFVNKRLRYYCEQSEWNDGGCTHDGTSVAPMDRDAIALVHQDLTPYPRHLRHEFNNLIEYGARNELQKIDFEATETVLEQSANRKMQKVSEKDIGILDWLEKRGSSSVNGVSNELGESPYKTRESINLLEKEGLVRATKEGRGVQYKTTEQARKALSNQRES